MKILVKVTRDVLERSKMCGLVEGKSLHNTNCGIAVAVRDLFPDANAWHYSCYLVDGDARTRVALPIEATAFINTFDSFSPEQRVSMSPFSFEIEVPEYVISKIGIGQIYKTLSESATLEMVMPKEIGQTVHV